MPNYYLLCTDETVVFILKGPQPTNATQVSSYRCSKNIDDCFIQTSPSSYENSILELSFTGQDEKTDSIVIVPSINPQTVTNIIVKTNEKKQLLDNLFDGKCPKKITINPAIFPSLTTSNTKRIHGSFFAENTPSQPPKKKAFLEQHINSCLFENQKLNNENTQEVSKSTIHRLTTFEQHFQILESAFREARDSILITSYGINHETLYSTKLYQLIPLARSRGVKIYFYYNDHKTLNKNILEFFAEYGVNCSEAYTHSKILAIDRNLVAAGSFNWLSALNSNYEKSEESSLVTRGVICDLLLTDIWKHINHYRNQQYANKKQLKKFNRNPYNRCSLIYEIDNTTSLTYLPTLEQHCMFLSDIFNKARSRVILCSPFISSGRDYEQDIDLKLLYRVTSRGVNIYFICPTESNYVNQFKLYLDQLKSPNIHIICVGNFHQKTIVVDNEMIAEGSFNWLSASRNKNSEYHNHEQTFIIGGTGAKSLIENFFNSRVGQIVANSMPKPSNQDKIPTISLSC